MAATRPRSRLVFQSRHPMYQATPSTVVGPCGKKFTRKETSIHICFSLRRKKHRLNVRCATPVLSLHGVAGREKDEEAGKTEKGKGRAHRRDQERGLVNTPPCSGAPKRQDGDWKMNVVALGVVGARDAVLVSAIFSKTCVTTKHTKQSGVGYEVRTDVRREV